ncbi:MAG: hypothetical protein QOE25_1470, partial [Actinomycetota bacterium]|nr:hypothetical protein [Actinomycetota bacterium]
LHERDVTGAGQHVGVSLFDASVAAMVNQAANYLVGGQVPAAMGSQHPNIVPYQVFRAADRGFVLAAGNDRLFTRTCGVLDHLDWAVDPRFATNEARVANRVTLVEKLSEVFAIKPADTWLAALTDAGVPCSPIRSMDEVFASPEGAALIQEIADPLRGPLRLVADPIRFDGRMLPVRYPPPVLGEHADLLED